MNLAGATQAATYRPASSASLLSNGIGNAVKIEQHDVAENDHLAADAIADLRYPETRRPRCVTCAGAVLV
jgi:hypothetical protein